MKIKFITTQKNPTQEGFGLLETTAAAMLSLLFVSMGANLVLTANLYKIKAKRNDVMNSLIRADIESVKYQSTKIKSTLPRCNTSILEDGFAGELKGKIGADSTADLTIKTTTVKILGHKYVLTRKTNPITDKDILPISYSFAAEAPSGTTQAEMPIEYELPTRVIPNASLNCGNAS